MKFPRLFSPIGIGSGAAMIWMQNTHVNLVGSRSPEHTRIYDESHMTGFARIADSIHRGGTKAAIHLSHMGRSVSVTDARKEPKGGRVVPSAIA